MNIIEVRNVTKVYNKKNPFVALKNVSLNVKKGDFLTIVGPSGSGKTTLLNIIGGIDADYDGMNKIKGINYHELSDKELASKRREDVSFIFQSFHLMPSLTVEENICLSAKIKKYKVNRFELNDVLSKFGLMEKRKSFIDELSRGQQQRVAIARSLLSRTDIILADEPTGNLDSKNAQLVFDILKSLTREKQKTVIFITHNMELAKQSDRIVQIRDGVLYET